MAGISREQYVRMHGDKLNPAFKRNTRMAVQEMSDDDAIDMLVSLEDAFKGFGTDQDKPVGPAMEKVIGVIDEYRRLNNQMIAAGVKPKSINGLQELQLRDLKGGAPAPYIKGSRDRETRVHTKREANAITGRKEVVPFMDPSDPTTPLVTTFEQRPDLRPPGFGGNDPSAIELVQLQALKLAGMPATLYGTGGAPHHYADFAVKTDDTPIKVEGMMVNRGDEDLNRNTPIPSYTDLVDLTDRNFTPKSLTQKVKDRAYEMKTKDYIKATESLINDGILGVDSEHRFGKLMRSELSNVQNDPKAVYDAMIVLGMNETPEGDRRFQQRMYPPDTIQYIPDVKATKDAVRNSSYGIFGGREANLGATGGGHRRSKIQHMIPSNHPTIRDMTEVAPHTAQLLRELPYA